MTDGALKIIKDSSKQRTAQYAARADFCRIFAEDMKNLYLLSFVLTADSEKAEQCFLSGLDDCITGNQVFGEWARSWARRVVIKNAIRRIAPAPERASQVPNPLAVKKAQLSNGARPQTGPVEISAMFELSPFERFAFVMSVLEGYSDQDCALLLGCAREKVIGARAGALQQIGEFAEAPNGLHRNTRLKVESLRDHRDSIEEEKLPARLATPA